MTDLISRQAAIKAIESHLRVGDEVYPLTRTDKILNHAFEIAASCVYNLPTAERVGKWIYKEIDDETGIEDHEFCSECGFPRAQIYGNFCAVCGARMRGDGDGKPT